MILDEDEVGILREDELGSLDGIDVRDGPTTESDEEYVQGPYVATLVRLSSMIESGSELGNEDKTIYHRLKSSSSIRQASMSSLNRSMVFNDTINESDDEDVFPSAVRESTRLYDGMPAESVTSFADSDYGPATEQEIRMVQGMAGFENVKIERDLSEPKRAEYQDIDDSAMKDFKLICNKGIEYKILDGMKYFDVECWAKIANVSGTGKVRVYIQ